MGCSRKSRVFGTKLKAFLESGWVTEAMERLPEVAPEGRSHMSFDPTGAWGWSFLHGGCGVLAHALKKWSKSRIQPWSVVFEATSRAREQTAAERVLHVVGKLEDDCFVDAAGAWSSKKLLNRYRRGLLPAKPRMWLEPYAPSRDVFCPLEPISALALMLEEDEGHSFQGRRRKPPRRRRTGR
jgi:hypothetical protein